MPESLSALHSWCLELESCVHADSEGGSLAAVWLKDGVENEALEKDFLWSDSTSTQTVELRIGPITAEHPGGYAALQAL